VTDRKKKRKETRIEKKQERPVIEIYEERKVGGWVCNGIKEKEKDEREGK
jgi:hypothetical protein